MRLHKLVAPALALAVASFLTAPPAAAKGGPKPKVKPVAVNAAKAKPPKVAAPKAKAPKANTVKAKAPAPKAPKAKSAAPKAKSTGPKTGSKVASPGGNTANTANTAVPQSKAQQLLAKNTNLRAKLQSRLPPNTDVNAAAAGFRNLGQFVAAVNVSFNHGIPFADLKVLMTGDHPLSLGQALQQLRGLDANAANQVASPALNQANQEIGATNTASARAAKDRR
jgi:hypothetical protein